MKEIRHKSRIHCRAGLGLIVVEETESEYLVCYDWNHNFEWVSKEEYEETPDPYVGCGFTHEKTLTDDGSELWEICPGNMEIIATWPTGKHGNPFYQTIAIQRGAS